MCSVVGGWTFTWPPDLCAGWSTSVCHASVRLSSYLVYTMSSMSVTETLECGPECIVSCQMPQLLQQSDFQQALSLPLIEQSADEQYAHRVFKQSHCDSFWFNMENKCMCTCPIFECWRIDVVERRGCRPLLHFVNIISLVYQQYRILSLRWCAPAWNFK